MAGIDETNPFVPLKIAVLTVSDTRALADDKSGATLVTRIEAADKPMAGIDETKPVVPLKIAVLTVSDTRALADDKSGATLVTRIEAAGHSLAERAVVPDDVAAIRARVKAWIADPAVDVVITTGGTGFTGRDVTPEALEPLFEKRMDGFSKIGRAS